MKRTLSILTVLVIAISFCSVTHSSFAADQYDEDFDFAMTLLRVVSNAADMAAQINLEVWSEAGPSSVISCLDQLYKYGDKDLGYPRPSNGNMVYLVKVYGSSSKVFDGAGVYHLACTPLVNIEKVKEIIKTFRDNYPDHPEAIKALQEYYIKLSAYAEIVLHPTGSYISYNADIATFQKEIKELRANAEFEK